MGNKKIKINSEQDLNEALEIAHAARELGKQIVFEIAIHLLAKLYESAEEFYKNHRISIEIIEPSGERRKTCKGAGIVAGGVGGAFWGGRIAGHYGALVGLILGSIGGGLLGYGISHLSITVQKLNNGSAVVMLSPAVPT